MHAYLKILVLFSGLISFGQSQATCPDDSTCVDEESHSSLLQKVIEVRSHSADVKQGMNETGDWGRDECFDNRVCRANRYQYIKAAGAPQAADALLTSTLIAAFDKLCYKNDARPASAGAEIHCRKNLLSCGSGKHQSDDAMCRVSADGTQVQACFVDRCWAKDAWRCSSWGTKSTGDWATSVSCSVKMPRKAAGSTGDFTYVERSLVAQPGNVVSGSISPLTDISACMRACTKNPACNSFTLCESGPSGCWMHDKVIRINDESLKNLDRGSKDDRSESRRAYTVRQCKTWMKQRTTCPESKRIKTWAECKRAAWFVGLSPEKKIGSVTSDQTPAGCWYWPSMATFQQHRGSPSKVGFSTNPNGKNNGEYDSLCYKWPELDGKETDPFGEELNLLQQEEEEDHLAEKL